MPKLITSPEIQHDVPLAPLTTIGLGGAARYLVRCGSERAIVDALRWAHEEAIPCHVLGGGSNTIFADAGYHGLIIHVGIDGISFTANDACTVAVHVGAGVPWGKVVAAAIERGLAGLECLAGIPGCAGATPIQNVGAYGQDVSETIHAVHALNRETFESTLFHADECGFGYRSSRFKGTERDRYVITGVTFHLRCDGQPTLRYPELCDYVGDQPAWSLAAPGPSQLAVVRDSVLTLRRRKSMVVDKHDPESLSVGSFFLNPVLEPSAFAQFQTRCAEQGMAPPSYTGPEGIKVPAAWLVENAGFSRGMTRCGVGVSKRHALALVNRNGTTAELLALADAIRSTVDARFGIALQPEPVVVAAD